MMERTQAQVVISAFLVALISLGIWWAQERSLAMTAPPITSQPDLLSPLVEASGERTSHATKLGSESLSAQDRRGAIESFVKLLQSARVIELNFVWDGDSPVLNLNPPFAIGLHSSHKETAGMIPGGIAWAEDMMFFSGQHGAPTIDAVGHVSHSLKLYGGVEATANEGAQGLRVLGIEAYPQERLVNRGVLLDVTRFKGVEALAAGYEITAQDLEATAKTEGVQIRAGDSVLIRTGYGKFFKADKAKYMGYRPGPGESAARWLAEKKIFLTGDDQMSYEVVPEKGTVFPVHRTLIADHGIYLVENMNLEELAPVLAQEKIYEFVLVINPLRIKGATGSPLNAFALLP